MTAEQKRARSRAMLGEMEMSYREAANELGFNNSALGYILSSKRVDDVYNKLLVRYETFKQKGGS